MSTNQTVAYQCLCCGAGLGFDPEKQKFACEFCLSEFDEAELTNAGAAEAAEKQRADGEAYCEQMNLFTCPNCGAEVVADDNTVAQFCYYCHNPVIHAGRLSGQLQPHKVVPFRITREEAEEIFLKWCKKKWFLPRDFKSQAHAAQIKGVYYPFWVTDADAHGATDFKATRVRTWRSGDYTYTNTKVYRLERAGNIHFEDIVSSAYSQAEKDKEIARIAAEKDKEVAAIQAEKTLITAEAKADALRIEAEAEAEANTMIAKSLTAELIDKIKYERWNGQMPVISGEITPIVSLSDVVNKE